jgi:hypothetical protein
MEIDKTSQREKKKKRKTNMVIVKGKLLHIEIWRPINLGEIGISFYYS